MLLHQDVIFGLNPAWLSLGILGVTYILLLSESVNRTVIALLGAGLTVLSGIINQHQAIEGVDFNTLALLVGMMIIVGITRKSGLFEFVAIWSAKAVKARPAALLIMLSVITAVFSSLLDNVTTVLLIVPVTLLITDKLKVSPYPFLIAEIFASNIGGSATLIGDPPNIIIGTAVGLTFNDFIGVTAPIATIIMAVILFYIYLLFGRNLHTAAALRERVMLFEERDAISDPVLLIQSLFVLAIVMVGFVTAETTGLESGTVALIGAALLLLLHNVGQSHSSQSERVEKAFEEVEWGTVFFFIGLFIIVHGVAESGILAEAGEWMIGLTQGNTAIASLWILWISALVSSVIDNIPFVVTMIPLIESMQHGFTGGPETIESLWWALSLGACLGGNGSLVGASANIMVAGIAERSGARISFRGFLIIGLPVMVLTVAMAHLYLVIRYFI